MVQEDDRIIVADRGGHRPFASAAVEGTTTLSPGTPINSAVKEPVCCPAHPAAKPNPALSTRGTLTCPPDM